MRRREIERERKDEARTRREVRLHRREIESMHAQPLITYTNGAKGEFYRLVPNLCSVARATAPRLEGGLGTLIRERRYCVSNREKDAHPDGSIAFRTEPSGCRVRGMTTELCSWI